MRRDQIDNLLVGSEVDIMTYAEQVGKSFNFLTGSGGINIISPLAVVADHLIYILKQGEIKPASYLFIQTVLKSWGVTNFTELQQYLATNLSPIIKGIVTSDQMGPISSSDDKTSVVSATYLQNVKTDATRVMSLAHNLITLLYLFQNTKIRQAAICQLEEPNNVAGLADHSVSEIEGITGLDAAQLLADIFNKLERLLLESYKEPLLVTILDTLCKLELSIDSDSAGLLRSEVRQQVGVIEGKVVEAPEESMESAKQLAANLDREPEQVSEVIMTVARAIQATIKILGSSDTLNSFSDLSVRLRLIGNYLTYYCKSLDAFGINGELVSFAETKIITSAIANYLAAHIKRESIRGNNAQVTLDVPLDVLKEILRESIEDKVPVAEIMQKILDHWRVPIPASESLTTKGLASEKGEELFAALVSALRLAYLYRGNGANLYGGDFLDVPVSAEFLRGIQKILQNNYATMFRTIRTRTSVA